MRSNHSAMRLGRRPARHDPRTFRLAKYLPKTLAPPPVSADWCSKVQSWPMDRNDSIGDCTCAGVAHLLQAWTTYVGTPVILADDQVVGLYSAITGYDPSNPSTDQGAVELDVLNYWRSTGAVGHKIDAYARVAVANTDQVKTALSLFGGLYLGLALPLSAQSQTVWDATGGYQGRPGSWGGHCVVAQAYDENGLTVITWGQAKRMTWAFFSAYCDEAYACLSRDFLTATGTDPAGLAWDALEADLAALTA